MAGVGGVGHLTPAMKQTRREAQSGQAMVETAITMPLFVFIILGSLQLALAHQARLMAKYAAYKAVRVGALNHARVAPMERAATLVLLPMISYSGSGGKDYFYKTKTSTEYLASAARVALTGYRYPTAPPLSMVEVTVCSPTKSDQTDPSNGPQTAAFASGNAVIFDHPRYQAGNRQAPDNIGGYRNWEVTRLAIQVEFNYRMPIPFANMMIWLIHDNTMDGNLRRVTRTGMAVPPSPWAKRGRALGNAARAAMARRGEYVLPIRTYYAMRMHSDLYPGPDLPAQNECVVPDAK